MKTESSIAKTTNPNTVVGPLRTACATKLLWLLLLTLPAAVQAECYTYTTNSGTITITQYTGSDSVVTIPSMITGLPVTTIGDWAFLACSLTSVTIPSSVTTIGGGAFGYCRSLTRVTISNSVTTIGDSAFVDCTSLTNVTIPDGVTNIESRAFAWCASLTCVTIPHSVTAIGDAAFIYCTSLTGVYFLGNAPSPGEDVFYRDDSAIVYYLAGTTGWGTNFCGRPTELLPYNYTTNNDAITITGYTGCGGAVTIPRMINGLPVTSIGWCAFSSCTRLTSIAIPNSITSIGDWAFSVCTNLTSVSIPNSVTSIGSYAFYYCASLTSVSIPNSVTSIGSYAFYYCTSLTSVSIPNSVANLESGAFAYCASLTSVTIPNSVTSIGSYVFYYCTSLTGVYFKGNAPSFGGSLFYCDNNATVYYLPGSTGWGSTFGGLPTVLWNAQAQTSDGRLGVWANRFGFNITGSSNLVIVVEACTDFANPTWSPVETNVLSNGLSYFSDPQWTNYPGRFYRLRSP